MRKLTLAAALIVAMVCGGCELSPGANGTIQACDDQVMNVNGQQQSVRVCRDTGVPNSVAGW